jgi:hypothetical protein
MNLIKSLVEPKNIIILLVAASSDTSIPTARKRSST